MRKQAYRKVRLFLNGDRGPIFKLPLTWDHDACSQQCNHRSPWSLCSGNWVRACLPCLCRLPADKGRDDTLGECLGLYNLHRHPGLRPMIFGIFNIRT